VIQGEEEVKPSVDNDAFRCARRNRKTHIRACSPERGLRRQSRIWHKHSKGGPMGSVIHKQKETNMFKNKL